MLWKNLKKSIGDRTGTSLRLADDIGALAEEEHAKPAQGISAEKTKPMSTVPMASRGRSRLKDRSLEQ